MKKGVLWVTLVMEMINPLDHTNFAQQEKAFILMFSIHCEPYSDGSFERMDKGPGNKYPTEEKEGPVRNICRSRHLCLSFSFFLTRGLHYPAGFSLGGGGGS